MSEWRDCTSYQRGDDRVPRAWELRMPELRIVVLTGHRASPDRWVMHCEPWFNTKELGLASDAPAAEAQRVALAMVTRRVAAISAALNSAQGEATE